MQLANLDQPIFQKIHKMTTKWPLPQMTLIGLMTQPIWRQLQSKKIKFASSIPKKSWLAGPFQIGWVHSELAESIPNRLSPFQIGWVLHSKSAESILNWLSQFHFDWVHSIFPGFCFGPLIDVWGNCLESLARVINRNDWLEQLAGMIG